MGELRLGADLQKKMGYIKTQCFFFLWNIVLVTPMTLLVWRMIWGLSNVFVVKAECADEDDGCQRRRYVGRIAYCVCGATLRVLNELTQTLVGRWVQRAGTKPGTGFLLGLFNYAYMTVNIFVSVFMWAGSWALLDTLQDALKE